MNVKADPEKSVILAIMVRNKMEIPHSRVWAKPREPECLLVSLVAPGSRHDRDKRWPSSGVAPLVLPSPASAKEFSVLCSHCLQLQHFLIFLRKSSFLRKRWISLSLVEKTPQQGFAWAGITDNSVNCSREFWAAGDLETHLTDKWQQSQGPREVVLWGSWGLQGP